MIAFGDKRFRLGNIAQAAQAVDEFIEQSFGDRAVDRFQAKRDVVQHLLGQRRIQSLLRYGQRI